MTSSTHPEVEIVYEEPIEPLKEGEHHSTVEIVKKLNEVIKELNTRK